MISSTWAANISSNVPGGWGVVPVYVGAQAPYSTCSSNDYNDQIQSSNATNQGITDGYNAAQVVEAQGFYDLVFDDMENFYYFNSNCAGMVCAYLNGWVYAVHNSGLRAGVYGLQAAECESSLAGNPAQHLPDYIWPSHYGEQYESAWNVCYDICIPNGQWVYDQRDAQYGPSLVSPNGLSYDADCVDSAAEGGLTGSVWDAGSYNDGNGGIGESYSPSDDTFC
jgi:hypothetical protein